MGGADEDGLGSKVPVDEAHRVRAPEGVARLEQDLPGLAGVHRPTGDPRRERISLEALHRDPRAVDLVHGGGDHLGDVLARDPGSAPRLAHEPLARIGVREDPGAEELQRPPLARRPLLRLEEPRSVPRRSHFAKDSEVPTHDRPRFDPL
ncbi:MAG: hypothetical protein U0414_03330 [Polyangiaceae bacterium]